MIIKILLCCKIKGTYTEGEPLECDLAKSGFADNFLHQFSLRECLDGFRKVGIGTLVFGK